jgi:hypothetical protein
MLLLLFMSMGWDYVFEVRLSTGPLFISQVIYMSMEPWGNDIDKEKLKLGEKPVPVRLYPPQIPHGHLA